MKKPSLLSLIVMTLIASPAMAADTAYELSIGGITCPACVGRAEKDLKAMEGVSSVKTDIDAGIITVCADSRVKLDDKQLKSMFAERGFTFNGMTRHEGC
jgi:copper chaperone CopZ